MTRFVSGRRSQLPEALFHDLCRYRHEIFVQTLGWNLPPRGEKDLELDEFDGDDAVYVIALRDDGAICGTARLLPTTRPYLLEMLFPELKQALPGRSPAVWELSRLAASTSDARVAGLTFEPLNRTRVELSSALLAETVHVARSLGARTLIGAVSRPLVRRLRQLGVNTQRLGPGRIFDAAIAMPCSIDLEAHERWIDERRRVRPRNRLPCALVRRREDDQHHAQPGSTA
jgi:acyl homoserine lactone synthase